MEMELGPLPAYAESGRAPNRAEQQSLLQQEAQARNATTRQATTPITPRYRRIAHRITRDGDGIQAAGGTSVTTTPLPTRATSKMHPSPAGQPKPLLPVTERRLYEERSPGKKSKAGSHDIGKEKWNITPDGGSAGREGRQFAVWNVGNNGRIYLRPSVRPAHQRFPQPQFVFPLTPPGTTAGVDVLAPARDQQDVKQHEDASLLFAENQLTPSYLSSTPATSYLGVKKKSLPGFRHRRAMSDSTVPDSNIIAPESDRGGFKIVITQPGDEQRPRTVDALDPNKGSLLEVSIPSWKLGTPRFSMRGTPFLRGSSYAPTEDVRHSSTSIVNHTPRELTPRDSRYNQVAHAHHDYLGPHTPLTIMTAPLLPLRSTFLSPQTSIEPAMFDALTFRPACDDRSIVRYSPSTRAVTAATPPRLVAEITSPSFLDYDLISDFFLTFRTFLDCSDLIRMLIARLRWAFAQPDKEIGTVVRVRTFVALRHWILNYFLEDFVANSDLRIAFCSLVNELMEELSNKPHSNKAWIKILVEIKRCWRGACAQYWDGPEHETTAGPYEPIHPGGIPGHRDSKLDSALWNQAEAHPPRLDDILLPHATGNDSGLFADFSRAAHIDSVMKDDRPATPEIGTADEEIDRNQASPTSIASLDVISCSFPTKNLRSAAKAVQPPLAAHPVDPSSTYASDPDPVATTPRSLMGKRIRTAQPQHKRNGSLSDSLREQGMSTTTEQPVVYKNAEFLLKLPYGGNLVRGNILPPGQAFVEVDQASSNGTLTRQTTMFDQSPTDNHKFKLPASAMSGRGMKRLLGSVRRALSTRVDSVSPTQANVFNMPPIGPRGATTNRLPGTAIVPQARPPITGNRPPVRIDLLGAEIAEDFKKAVRDDAAEAEKRAASSTLPDTPEETPLYSAAHMDGAPASRHVSDMAVTTGSQSIVIVDDTIAAGFPAMSGAIPASNASVEAFAESFMPNLADPTPPNTPPDRPTGTPRRSSYILSQQAVQPSLESDPLPPFVPDLDTLGRVQSTNVRPSLDTTRSSMDYMHQSLQRPPLSGRQGQLRHPSRRSHRSIKSLRRPRYASFTSGITPQPTIRSIRSFDATTCSGGSVIDGMSDVPIPHPLRVLRRRPGGDLRAITKAGDLHPGSLRSSRSVGSLSTFDDSIRGSYIHTARPASTRSAGDAVGSSDDPSENAKVFSLGAIAEQHPKHQLSLFSTHSSKPIMRPSFEAEAQKLAQIPDDIDDDGGVQSALMKLEGKYEKKTRKLPVSMQFESPRKPDQESSESLRTQPDDLAISREEKLEHRHVQVEEDHVIHAPATYASGENPGMNLLSVPDAGKADDEGQSFLSDDSHTSYTSTPLLDRGLTEDSVSRRTLTAEWTNRSIFQGPEQEDGLTPTDGNGLDSQHPSYDFVKKTESMEKIAPGETLPAIIDPRQSTEVSFLDVDSDDDTDLSSEMSLEFLGSNEDDDIFPALKSSPLDAALPLNPLGTNPTGSESGSNSREGLPSPYITQSHAPEMGPQGCVDPPNSNKIPIVHEHQLWGEKPLPPTPDTTPTTAYMPHNRSFGSSDPTGTREALQHAPTLDIPDPVPQQTALPRNKFSVHLPFILAFDSDVLAQQFTLVEKDALAEIDWKDLIDMKWKNAEQTGTNTRSWVSFLRDTDARGVEVVIARFNIMVKWAVSEIVLTQDLEERARCIIKYIHIAVHCRRYRNFATASQLTIALTSPEVSRLSRTWDLVPAKDIQSLRDLEALISPTRNFYNLRKEMEGGGSPGAASTDLGCIPFVGIYTHDLLFNAQRPSEIASSPSTPPLVNFERCRMAASVVKTLLRLLEASHKYTFQPIEGLTERCLWMSALSDEEMRRLAESLE